ncbi:MAG: ATP-binding protein, partial [Candidatus Poribacteria bacterium]|nr:ATP-binding protein [Candidatus Poribacteria bacterium]
MSEELTLDIDLNVLNHLGLNLYSNVPAVLAELIANAWDADASRVDVSVKEQDEGKRIIIQDNGCGMDRTELQEKFLTVGYQRRSKGSGDQTAGGRSVMGRKGIGKLSVLSIARKVYVYTKKEDTDPLAIELDVKKIQEAIEKKQKYRPPVINEPKDINFENSGTALVLTDIKR